MRVENIQPISIVSSRKMGLRFSLRQVTKELLAENTVDFISFSYYMSVVAAHDPENYSSGRGNLLGGIMNPHLASSEWGWQINQSACAWF